MNILLDASARPVIGHRGNRAHAPENTIESFAQAVSIGAEAIEFDIHISADGVPVVHHDPTLERTTNGKGELAQKSFGELRELDAGYQFTKDGGKTFPYRGRGHRIPTLDEVIEAFPSTPLLIEIKNPLAATGVKNALESHRAQERSLVEAMDIRATRVFAGSQIAVGAAKSDVIRLTNEVLLKRPITPFEYRALCVPLSYFGIPLPVRQFAKVGLENDCRVHVWTINDVQVAKDLWLAGINGIISDDPAIMLEARATLPPVRAA